MQLVKKFPAFHGTRRFITALTSVRHMSLSWASPIQSIYPYPTSLRSILILSTHLRLGLPSGPLPSGFTTKTLHTPLSSPIRATCPAHPIYLDFITRTILGEEYRSFSSSLCSLLHSPVTYSPIYASVSPVFSFPPVSPLRPYTPPSPHPYAPHALPISYFSILSPAQYWVSSTNHLAPRYAICLLLYNRDLLD